LLVVAGLLTLALSASVAIAAGIAANWKDACWGENPHPNLSWTCNTNATDDIRITCSFVLDENLPDFVGVHAYLVGMTEAAVVPDWWRLGADPATNCRADLCTVAADGTVLEFGGTDICLDPWHRAGAGGIGAYTWEDNRMSVDAWWTLAETVPLEASQEYFALQFRISAEKTVGECPGCLVPAIWALDRIDVQTSTATLTLDRPYMGGWRCLTWQASTLPCQVIDFPDPVRCRSWGLIKSLYR
jgi:hypothetical protein